MNTPHHWTRHCTQARFPSGVLPASLHLALLELVTSGFCSAVLRLVKYEVSQSKAI